MGNVDEASICHRIFLIRHGETVDNVAGLYAGTRDSALTVHGVQQAKRLAQHFQDDGISLTHIFASNLSRAVNTARALRDAQPKPSALGITQCEDLREQDFGSYEGVSFHPRDRNVFDESLRRNIEFRDMETKESMAFRANRFLDSHLVHLLSSPTPSTVVIVSHGMLLMSLWRCILHRQPASSVEVDPDAISDSISSSLERLGRWSNTGYLDLEFSLIRSRDDAKNMNDMAISSDRQLSEDIEVSTTPQNEDKAGNLALQPSDSGIRSQFKIRVREANSRRHLEGLKRAKGGIGSARYDEKQKSIGDFFTKKSAS